MSCVRCGNYKTIKAHLIPQVFCKEIQVGKAHAAGIRKNGRFFPTQSGTFDKDILCESCDGQLGVLEEYASKVLRSARRSCVGRTFGIKLIDEVEKEKIYRFCAAILWKYSITQKSYGRINLHGYQDDVQRIAYGEIEIPDWFDVAMFRLQVHVFDDGAFAYRAPLVDKKDRVRLYRFMLGGFLFFVKVHRKRMRDPTLSKLWLSNPGAMRFVLIQAQFFEEFQLSRALAFTSEGLSEFLDRQEECRIDHGR